jgi:hypothetical protein
VGTGTQIFFLSLFIFALALIGVFYPYNRCAGCYGSQNAVTVCAACHVSCTVGCLWVFVCTDRCCVDSLLCSTFPSFMAAAAGVRYSRH